MAINLLNLEPVKASTDLSSYASFIYGIPKIGKTTFVHDLYGDDVLFIATEKRHKVLTGAYVQYISSWVEYTTIMGQLRNPKLKDRFKVVVIDTVENLYEMLEKYILAKYNKTEFGQVDWGKDWTDLKKSWKDGITMPERLGYTPCFVSHATQITAKIPVSGILESKVDSEIMTLKEDKKSNEKYYEYTRYVPDLKDKVMAPINKMVDNILFMTNTIDTNGEEQRVIHLRDSLQWQAGSTFTGIDPVIPLDAKAYNDAVERALGLIDPSQTKSERETLSIDKPKYDFDKVMKKAKSLGVKFHKAGQMNALNRIVDEVFGAGQKLTEATKDQIEPLVVAVARMEEAYKEIDKKLKAEAKAKATKEDKTEEKEA